MNLNKTEPKFDLDNTVRTPGRLTGKIIGMAEYRWGWDYRVKFVDRPKTRYYHEKQLTKV
jgi:hypothetical protein